MNIGSKILQLRKKAGMSQEELAEKMNISRQAVSRWETGEAIPEPEKIVLLSKLFQVPTDYLLLNELEEIPAPFILEQQSTLRNDTMPADAETISPVKSKWSPALKWAAGFGLAGFAFILTAIIMAGVFSDNMTEWYTDYGRFGTALLFTWRAAILYIGLGLLAVGLVIVAIYAGLRWKPVALVMMFAAVFLIAFSIICSGIVLGLPALILIIALLVFLLVVWVKALVRKRRNTQPENVG